MNSFYLDRLINSIEKRMGGYHDKNQTHKTWWVNRSVRLANPALMITNEIVYYEETYKGHQLIIQSIKRDWCYAFDSNGNPFQDTSFEIEDVASKGEIVNDDYHCAFSWRIGTAYDQQAELNWQTDHATLAGICSTNSFDKTLKMARKKLDIEDKLVQVLPTLISIAPIRWNGGFTDNSEFTPYNAVVGDQVFIQAHGRLRKGIIVETTGRRFIVGYVTPSNHYDLKTKTLNLSEMCTLEN
jgi:hypothetical protein